MNSTLALSLREAAQARREHRIEDARDYLAGHRLILRYRVSGVQWLARAERAIAASVRVERRAAE